METQKDSLIDRILSETPKWFKLIRNFGVGFVAAGISLKALEFDLGIWHDVANHLIIVGTVLVAVCQTASTRSSK